jgi:hypothetical protein
MQAPSSERNAISSLMSSVDRAGAIAVVAA